MDDNHETELPIESEELPPLGAGQLRISIKEAGEVRVEVSLKLARCGEQLHAKMRTDASKRGFSPNWSSRRPSLTLSGWSVTISADPLREFSP
jgi:hypothetical protein